MTSKTVCLGTGVLESLDDASLHLDCTFVSLVSGHPRPPTLRGPTLRGPTLRGPTLRVDQHVLTLGRRQHFKIGHWCRNKNELRTEKNLNKMLRIQHNPTSLSTAKKKIGLSRKNLMEILFGLSRKKGPLPKSNWPKSNWPKSNGPNSNKPVGLSRIGLSRASPSCTNASLQPVLPVQDRATRQPGKHTLTLRETVDSRTTRVPRLYTQSIPVHIGAHPFDTWVTGPVVVYATRLDEREDVGQLELAIQPNAAARPRGGPWSR